MRKLATSTGLLAMVLAAATASAQPSFRASIGDSIQNGAINMVVDDLDEDGNNDLIFAGGQSGTISVFYGFGDGFFDPEQNYFANSVPVAVAVGRFDADDRKDLVLVDSTSSTISVLLATDSRSFGDPIETRPLSCALSGEPCEIDDNCPEGQTCEERGVNSPNDIVVADLNGDGPLDVAIVSGESLGQVSVAFGNNDGTFSAPIQSPYDTGPTSRALAVGNLNDDERPDLVAANRDGASISVLINAGNGGFLVATSFAAGEAPIGIALGDWNDDERLDVVVANRNSDRFSLLLGNGAGAFGAPVSFAAGSFPSSIAAGDFDLDGHLDVVVGNSLSYDVTIGFGDGEGSFGLLKSYLGGTAPARVVVARINGDDLPDAVVYDDLPDIGGSDEYTILMADAAEGGTPGRSFVAAETVRAMANPGSIAVGDLNQDARPDAVVTSGGDLALTVMRTTGDPDRAFVGSALAVGAPTSAVLLADLDLDGHAELLYARPAVVPTPTATGEGGAPVTPSPSAGDLLAVARSDGMGGFVDPVLTTVGRAVSGIDVADYNEDGRLDVVISEGEDDRVAILLLQANGTFAAPVRINLRPLGDPDPIFPQAVAAGDLDGDTHADIAVADFRDAGLLSIVYGDGDGTFENPVTRASGRRPVAVVIIDVDNDGLPDILTANQDTQGLVLHHASAPRTYDNPRFFTAGRVPSSLVLRDVSGDGIRDAITGDFVDDLFLIRTGGRALMPWFNAATNVCPNFPCLATGRSPKGVAGGDFDDDGSYDLLSTNSGGANLAVVLSLLESDVRRGDGNEDTFVSVADLTALMGVLPGRNRAAIEDLRRSDDEDLHVATLNFDADGDGLMSTVDSTAIIGRLFR